MSAVEVKAESQDAQSILNVALRAMNARNSVKNLGLHKIVVGRNGSVAIKFERVLHSALNFVDNSQIHHRLDRVIVCIRARNEVHRFSLSVIHKILKQCLSLIDIALNAIKICLALAFPVIKFLRRLKDFLVFVARLYVIIKKSFRIFILPKFKKALDCILCQKRRIKIS